MKTRHFLFLAVAVAGCAAALPWASAQTVENRSDYSVSLVGLPVASMSFVTTVDGAGYRISGSMRTSALTDIVGKTRGTAEASGRVRGDRFQATSYLVSYTSGNRTHRTEMRLRNGNVQSAVNTPQRKVKPANWVPVDASHLRAVVDPLSSLIIPVGGKKGAQVCNRSLPIFDGESRIDLVLSDKGVRPYSTTGFSGDAIVCTVRFIPKAGYRKGHSSIEYMRKLAGMEIWFGKHPGGDFFAPVYAKIPTKIGQVTVAATRFGG